MDDLNNELNKLKKEKTELDKQVADIDLELKNVDKQLTDAEAVRELSEKQGGEPIVVSPAEGPPNER